MTLQFPPKLSPGSVGSGDPSGRRLSAVGNVCEQQVRFWVETQEIKTKDKLKFKKRRDEQEAT